LNTKKPLSDLRVVELTTYIAAPMCGRLLADWGADVIKVESLTGDVWRYASPLMNVPLNEQENPIFDVANTNKKCITLDLKSEEGMRIFYSLLENADIFLTNNRPQALKKMGIDYESVKARFPRLIYAAITGFGEAGPDRDLPGFDVVAYWSRSGFLTDLSVDTGSNYPVIAPAGYGDTISGTALFGGITSCLLTREKTGRGDYVSVSLFGASIWAASYMVISTQERYGAKYPRTRSECSPLNAAYRCSDGEWIMIAVNDFNKHFKLLCRIIGIPDTADDPRFATLTDVMAHTADIFPLLQDAFAQYDSVAAADMLSRAGIVNDIMHHFRDLANDVQAQANNYVTLAEFPSGGVAAVTNPPYTCASLGTPRFKPASLLGGDNNEVLQSIGYSAEQILALKGKNII